jgi:hypothetical protein
MKRFEEQGWVIKKAQITEEFTYEIYQKEYGDRAIPLCIKDNKKLNPVLAGVSINPKLGNVIISLVKEQEKK